MKGGTLPQEQAELTVHAVAADRQAMSARASRGRTSPPVSAARAPGAAGCRSASSCCRSFFVIWLAFFRQEIPSFPPEGYSLRWFARDPRQQELRRRLLLSFQVGVAATLIGLALGGAGEPLRSRAGSFARPRRRQHAAADAARRAGRRAGHVDLRLPDRGRDRDRRRRARHLPRRWSPRHVADRHPLGGAAGDGEPRRLRSARSRKRRKNLGANAVDDLPAHHPAGDPARHRGRRAVRLRHLVRQSRDEPVPGRRRPHHAADRHPAVSRMEDRSDHRRGLGGADRC